MAPFKKLEVVRLSDRVVPADRVRVEQLQELAEGAAELVEIGVSRKDAVEELFTFCQEKHWKYHQHELNAIVAEAEKRQDELDRLELEQMNSPTATAGDVVPPDELRVVSLADVVPAPLRWLVPGRIPLGKVTVVYGEAGLGKTSWALDLAARVSQKSGDAGGHVVIVNGEDQLAEVIQPRLIGGGANLQKITAIAEMTVGVSARAVAAAEAAGTMDQLVQARPFDLGRDLPALRKQIETLGDVKLVVIDPLEAYCGKSGFSKWKMRAVVAELEKIAAGCGVAVVVVSANTKCDLPVKNVWRVDCDLADSEVRSWVPVRFNLGALPEGAWFRVTDQGIAWDTSLRPLPTANSVRGSTPREVRNSHTKEIAACLGQFLAGGRRPAKEVFEAGAVRGFSVSQIKRTKRAMGVCCYKDVVENGPWLWEIDQPREEGEVPVEALNEGEKLAIERLEKVKCEEV